MKKIFFVIIIMLISVLGYSQVTNADGSYRTCYGDGPPTTTYPLEKYSCQEYLDTTNNVKYIMVQSEGKFLNRDSLVQTGALTIYTGDGVLPGTRTIDLDGNYLSFSDGYLVTGYTGKTYIGILTGGPTSTGNYAVGIGYNAMNGVTGQQNIGLGYQTSRNNTGSNNIALGSLVLDDNTGSFNVGIGDHSLQDNTSNYNVGIGYYSLDGNEGLSNIGLGERVLQDNQGEFNIALGHNSNSSSNTGDNNISLGTYALYSNTGSYNIAIGQRAGYNSSVSNKLWIKQNDINTTPLIYGDFSTGQLAINSSTLNGTLNIGGDLTTDTLRTESIQSENNLYIEADTIFMTGEIRYDSTMWDDLLIPLTSSNKGGLNDPNFIQVIDDGGTSTGVYSYAFDDSSEEELFFVAQLSHRYKHGTDLLTHIHWTAPTTSTDTVVWGLEYTVQSIGNTFGNTTTITGKGGGTGTALDHILTNIGVIDGTGLTGSSIVIGRIFRDATNVDDDMTGDVFGLDIDFHYQIDKPGSANYNPNE